MHINYKNITKASIMQLKNNIKHTITSEELKLKSKQSLKTKTKNITWFRRKTIVGWLLGFDIHIFCHYVGHLFFVISERKYQILPQVVKRKNFFVHHSKPWTKETCNFPGDVPCLPGRVELALPTSPASCRVALDSPLGIGMEDVIFLLGGRHITVLL